MTPEQLHGRKPYELFGLTEEEANRFRVTDERLKQILADPNTTTHAVKTSTNGFGEFLFVTTSRGVNQQVICMTFYGLGYHEHRERWIKDEWFWYQTQESLVDTQTKMSGEDVSEKIKQRLEKISPHFDEKLQSLRGKVFEYFADLSDDDAALADMEVLAKILTCSDKAEN